MHNIFIYLFYFISHYFCFNILLQSCVSSKKKGGNYSISQHDSNSPGSTKIAIDMQHSDLDESYTPPQKPSPPIRTTPPLHCSTPPLHCSTPPLHSSTPPLHKVNGPDFNTIPPPPPLPALPNGTLLHNVSMHGYDCGLLTFKATRGIKFGTLVGFSTTIGLHMAG